MAAPSKKDFDQLKREFDALQTVLMSLARQVDEQAERLKVLEERKR